MKIKVPSNISLSFLIFGGYSFKGVTSHFLYENADSSFMFISLFESCRYVELVAAPSC